MITIEELQKLKEIYNYDSKNMEPYLYDDGENKGYYYTFKDKIYGYLNRVYIPEDSERAKEFLKKYQNYQNNKNSYQIILENYKELFATPIFKEKIETLDEKEVEANINQKKTKDFKRKYRTALLLIKIIEAKNELQDWSVTNLEQLKNKFEEVEKERKLLKNKYENIKNDKDSHEEEREIKKITIDNHQCYQELNLITKEEDLDNFIKSLITKLKEFEEDETILKQKYLLLKLPIEINIYRKEIETINKLLEKKRIFSKKESLKKHFLDIEDESEIKKIVTVGAYINNEKERIREKYEMINDIEIGTVADYLIEFDNLQIDDKDIKEYSIKEEEKSISLEEVMQNLEKQFDNLSENEKNTLYIYASFLKNIIQNLQNNIYYKDEIDEALEVMNQTNNILVKLKIFKNADLSRQDKFIEYLKTISQKMLEIKPTTLNRDITLYFQEEKIINTKWLFTTSNINFISSGKKLEYPINYIATLKKNTEFYFLPKELIIDIKNDDQLLLKENMRVFIINNEKINVFYDKSDIIKVATYQISENIEDKDANIITKIRNSKIDQYQKIIIERKEE